MRVQGSLADGARRGQSALVEHVDRLERFLSQVLEDPRPDRVRLDLALALAQLARYAADGKLNEIAIDDAAYVVRAVGGDVLRDRLTTATLRERLVTLAREERHG